MAQLSPECYYTEIQASTDALAAIVARQDPALPIPSCPDWTLRQLATHLGRTHRWVAEMVRRRAAEPIRLREVADCDFPAEAEDQAEWLHSGARLVVDVVAEAGDDRLWGFESPVPAGYWGRRMAHESLVHRVDGELACGTDSVIDPVLAADAIDEWLTVLIAPLAGAVAPLPPGAVLHVHATDSDLPGNGEWLVRHTEEGIAVEPGHGKGDVALSGPAKDLLLVLVRRQPADDAAVTVHGDASLLARWLENTRF